MAKRGGFPGGMPGNMNNLLFIVFFMPNYFIRILSIRYFISTLQSVYYHVSDYIFDTRQFQLTSQIS